MQTLLLLIIAIPAASAAILLLGGKYTDAWGHLTGAAAPLVVVRARRDCVRRPQRAQGRADHEAPVDLDRRRTSSMSSSGCSSTTLSALFVLLITGVGGLIHVYSVGYMAHDERRRRFFGYLNLFVAAMLILVLADDYLTLFLGWEGVGLASYLLIGFWQHKDSAAVAAKKAFIVNRVGDLGMALAIMLMFKTFG